MIRLKLFFICLKHEKPFDCFVKSVKRAWWESGVIQMKRGDF